MKKFFFPLLLCLCAFFGIRTAHASHLMGGEIVARQLTDSTYEVGLFVYRDTLGIPTELTAYFNVTDVLGMPVMSFFTDYDMAISGVLLPGYPYGVELYIYHDTIQLAPGTYNISYNTCCRNAAIINMSNPSGESMQLETVYTTYGAPTQNSTPVFLAPPVIYLPIATLWQYNPLPFDVDGDSLVWSIDTPLTSTNVNVTGYTEPPSAVGFVPFSIDAVTGMISWVAGQLGNFDASILVEEYRNGVKIGEIRRDMQMIVIQSSNKPPRISNISSLPMDNEGHPAVELLAGELYNITLLVDDEDLGDALSIEGYGEIFMEPGIGATLTTTLTGNNNEIAGTFSWTPSGTFVREMPYTTVFRVKDGNFQQDETVLFWVRPAATNGIGGAVAKVASPVYPNPVRDALYVPFALNSPSDVQLAVYDLAGRQVSATAALHFETGNQLVRMPVEVPAGSYFLKLIRNGVAVETQRFSVIR